MSDNTTELDFGTTAQKTTDAEKLPVVLLALDQGKYDMTRSLDELRALADANGMDAVAEVVQKRSTPEAATLLGEGKVAEARLVCQHVHAAAAIFDGALPGSQLRNLSAALHTEGTDTPVVFSAVSDPVGAGLVESLEAPGANLTGTSDYLDTASIMKLIEAVNPDTKKIGLLYDIGQDSSTAAIEAAKAYMDENGIEYVERTGTTTDEVQLAADALVADGVDAVFTPTDNTIMTAELSIYEKFIDAGIPHYTGADSFALNGAFAGYGVDYANLGAKTADMVADILLNGADPATTPVETFDNGTATVNTETCEALGLDFETVKAAMEPLCTQVNEIVTAESFDELEAN